MLQVFQLTTLVIRGVPTSGEKFTISLDRVAISEEEVRGVLLCVQAVSYTHLTLPTNREV